VNGIEIVSGVTFDAVTSMVDVVVTGIVGMPLNVNI
jgi:hypothetical protein